MMQIPNGTYTPLELEAVTTPEGMPGLEDLLECEPALSLIYDEYDMGAVTVTISDGAIIATWYPSDDALAISADAQAMAARLDAASSTYSPRACPFCAEPMRRELDGEHCDDCQADKSRNPHQCITLPLWTGAPRFRTTGTVYRLQTRTTATGTAQWVTPVTAVLYEGPERAQAEGIADLHNMRLTCGYGHFYQYESTRVVEVA